MPELGSHHVPIDDRCTALMGSIACFVDRHTVVIYGVLLACFAGLGLASALYMTLDVDEAWILLSTAHAFGVDVPLTAAYGKPTVTTGGLHLLVHGLVAIVTMNVFAHRAVSLLAAGGLLVLVYRGLRGQGVDPRTAVVGTTMFAAAPSFVWLSGLAMGEIIAGELLVAAALHWAAQGRSRWRSALGTGILLGAAISTRVNCAAALPGLFAFAMCAPAARRQALFCALIAALVATTIAAIAIGVYYASGHVATATDTAYLGMATGLNLQQPIAKAILSARIANEHLPFSLIIGIVGAWAIWKQRTSQADDRDNVSDWAGALLCFALPMLVAWLFLAPIPHLRYIWPALSCIWLAGVILLCDLAHRRREKLMRLTLHGIALAASGYALVAASISILTGESLTIAYQAMGLSPRLAPKPDRWLRATSDQRRMAAFAAGRPASARFFTSMLPVGYPTTYLSGRRVDPVAAMSADGDQYVLMFPADYTIWRPEPSFASWLRSYGRPVFRSGDYAAFKIIGGAPSAPIRRSAIGQNDLY